MHDKQVQANDAYRLLPMPVPAVLVTLHGAKGGLLLDEDTGKEVGTRSRRSENFLTPTTNDPRLCLGTRHRSFHVFLHRG